jgi:pimeloyl-ACP methyl ester carboxylesterase
MNITNTTPSNQQELHAAPSASVNVNVHGLRLHCLDYAIASVGNTPSPAQDVRPKMLCIHGGAANAHWFDFVVSAFTDRYRVLSLDLRGHGDSDWSTAAGEPDYSYGQYAADVAAVIDEMALGPVVLAGHSMGGMVSLVTAATYGQSVNALVVIDSMMQMTAQRASTLRGIGAGKGRSFASREAFIEGFKIRPEGSSAAPQVFRHMAFHSCRQFDDGQWRNKFDRNVYAKRHPIDAFDYWGDVKAPALLVAGGNSDRITEPVHEAIRGACPHVKLHTVAGAGHHVTLDNPAGYRAGVAAFLDAL